MKKTLQVMVWSDVVCPWCAIGKHRLEAAIAKFARRDEVEVVWRSFELDPSAPAVRAGDNATHLAQKYRRTKAQAEAMIQSVIDTAAKDGLDLHLNRARSGNTFDAHRLLHLALEKGVQNEVKSRFLRGYMTEGQAIGDHEVLVRLATEAGLDPQEVRAVLESDRYANDVREDEEMARELGVRGVPFFVFGGKLAVSGAQPMEVLLGALEEVEGSPPRTCSVDAETRRT